MVARRVGRSIAVVGAGPKAAAIAAKAEVLNRVLGWDIHVTIFEETGIGANWSGEGGYTDGEARLCTAVERDLGFPYNRWTDPRVARTMYAGYSWPAYLMEVGSKKEGISDWVNRGRRPPSHAVFAKYLEWAIRKSGASIQIAQVTRLQAMKTGWRVHTAAPSGSTPVPGRFDGVVLTGPGPALNRLVRTGSSDRIIDGRDFWRDPTGFLAKGKDFEEPVVIVGAGGTSAAIAARAVRESSVKAIVIVGGQAALFARTETFFENQIFSDEEFWDKLAPKTRREFTDRLNRGVVWATISDELSRSNKVVYEPGRGQSVEVVVRPPVPDELKVHITRGNVNAPAVAAGIVIDASGFDTWWFAGLLPRKYQASLRGSDPEREKRKRLRLTQKMGNDLSLFDRAPGPIHVPMLSQAVGPGFASLMTLGAMSDRILKRYGP